MKKNLLLLLLPIVVCLCFHSCKKDDNGAGGDTNPLAGTLWKYFDIEADYQTTPPELGIGFEQALLAEMENVNWTMFFRVDGICVSTLNGESAEARYQVIGNEIKMGEAVDGIFIVYKFSDNLLEMTVDHKEYLEQDLIENGIEGITIEKAQYTVNFTNHIVQKTNIAKKRATVVQIPTLTLPNPMLTPSREANAPMAMA